MTHATAVMHARRVMRHAMPDNFPSCVMCSSIVSEAY
jgi:hypothetical protein